MIADSWLVVDLRVEFCFPAAITGAGALGGDFLALYLPHHIHDALINSLQVAIGERSTIRLLGIVKNFTFAIGLVNRHPDFAFQPPNLMCRPRPLAEQIHQLAVNIVNFPSPICDVHKSGRPSALSRQLMRPAVLAR